MTPDLHYTDPRLARLYDGDSGWGPDRDFYLSLAGPMPCRILDLGCGTGLLCHAYAKLGHAVTGVDPAAAMLAIARERPRGAGITWVHAAAQGFASPARFDLIVMTGHAFQVLCDDADIAATLRVMRNHLAPGGTIAFETRNPAIDSAGRWDGRFYDHLLDGAVVRQTYHVNAAIDDCITFSTHYAFPDVTRIATSTLRFASQNTLTMLLQACGLQIKSIFGTWDRHPFNARTSDEMIFILGQ